MKNHGMPIFLEPDKKVADPISKLDVDAWLPANTAAQKWWRCIEVMRDLDLVLSSLESQKNATKRKRVLKIAITPLHSFAIAIDDLCNDIQCNQKTKNKLSVDDLKEVKEIQRLFNKLLPHDHKAVLTVVRNKLSAHIDKQIHPLDAQKMTQDFTPDEFGRWLHICLHIILDLTKLDIYEWSCKSPSDKYVRFTTNEPYIVTFLPDGPNGAELAGLNISSSSPKNEAGNLVEAMLKHSKWIFKKKKQPITCLKSTLGTNWNTFKEYCNIHKDF